MFLSKYGVARHIYIPIVKRAVIDFAVSADWTPGAGDVKISKDGGAFANVTNLPTAIASANTGAVWDFSLTATEMQAAQVVVVISDAATKTIEDQSFIIETYGNASAQHAMDFGTATIVASSLSAIAANVITAASMADDATTELQTGLVTRRNTAQAGGASTITLDAAASAVDNFYTGQQVVITGGTGAGQVRLIHSYVGATKVATVGTAWATNPDNTSVFALIPNRAMVTLFGADTVTAAAIAADAGTEIATAILDEAVAEPAGIFTWPTSLRKILSHLGVLTRNKATQTATTTVWRNDADNATLFSSTVSDDATTFVDGELT